MSNQSLTTKSSDHERSVRVRSVDEGSSLKDVHDGFTADGDGALEPKPVEFTVQEFTCFRCEYALKDRDLIVHFFLPSNVTEQTAGRYRDWWLKTFPLVLDKVAQDYFSAGPPRLAAKYTEEVASWWFKAQGYDHLLDPRGFLAKFLQVLDESCGA